MSGSVLTLVFLELFGLVSAGWVAIEMGCYRDGWVKEWMLDHRWLGDEEGG